MEKIESINSLLIHINKYVAAYRKSYRLCKGLHLSFQILSGVVGCGAVLAVVPAIPIVVAVAGAIPAGVSVILNIAKLKEKESAFKAQHRVFKQLLTETRIMSNVKDVDEKDVIRKIFSKILEIEKDPNYVVPLEKYMRYYKLNGYFQVNEKNKNI